MKEPKDMTDAELIAEARRIGHKSLMYCGRMKYGQEERDLYLDTGRLIDALASRLTAALERERLDVEVFLKVTRTHRKCCDMILRMAEARLAAREQKGGGNGE